MPSGERLGPSCRLARSVGMGWATRRQQQDVKGSMLRMTPTRGRIDDPAIFGKAISRQGEPCTADVQALGPDAIGASAG